MADKIKVEHNYITGGHRETNLSKLNKKKSIAKKMNKGKGIDMKAWHLKHGDYPDAKPGSDYMGAN